MNKKQLAYFRLASYNNVELRIALGDELRLHHPGNFHASPWEGVGHVVSIDLTDEVCLELRSYESQAPKRVTDGIYFREKKNKF